MLSKKKILCIGEILWDSLPSGIYLGGAPLNVCYHLNQLGVGAAIAGRVGTDRLGNDAIHRIEDMGVVTSLIQRDPEHETGFVSVSLDDEGDPRYEFVEPGAWDYIKLTDRLVKCAESSWGLVFGSLGQRNKVSRDTIQQLLKLDIRKIFDMNLRPPFVNKEIITHSLEATDILKVNQGELDQTKSWYGLSENDVEAADQICEQFDVSLICITRGADGAAVYRNGEWIEQKGFSVKTKDAVGAGDAFLAALLYGMVHNKKTDELLRYANATGSLVAQKDGATPVYSKEDIKEIENGL